jgi:hypothetical protein
MSIVFSCESCGKTFTLDDKFAGKKGKCKGCGAVMQIPEASPGLVPEPVRSPSRALASSRPQAVGSAPPPAFRSKPAPLPPPPPVADLYGFEDDLPPRPAPPGVEDGVEDDELDEPAALARSTWAPPKSSGSKKKKSRKKRSSNREDDGTVAKVILAAAFGWMILAGGFACFRVSGAGFAPVFSTKSELEGLLREKVELQGQTAVLLASVNDVNSARAASPRVNDKIKAMTANLRKIKNVKALKADSEAVGLAYRGPLKASLDTLLGQFMRIATIPDAYDALAIEASIQEMTMVEHELGLAPANFPAAPPRANVPPVAPNVPNNAMPGNPNPAPAPPAPPRLPRNRPGARRQPPPFGPR